MAPGDTLFCSGVTVLPLVFKGGKWSLLLVFSIIFFLSQSVSLNWKVCGTKWDFKKEPWLLIETLLSNFPIQLVKGYTCCFFVLVFPLLLWWCFRIPSTVPKVRMALTPLAAPLEKRKSWNEIELEGLVWTNHSKRFFDIWWLYIINGTTKILLLCAASIVTSIVLCSYVNGPRLFCPNLFSIL